MIFLTWTNRCCHRVAHVRFINGDSDCPNIPEFRVNKTKTMIKRLLKNNINIKRSHCAKSVRIRSFPGHIFPHFDLMQNRKTPNKDTFLSVSLVREVFHWGFSQNLRTGKLDEVLLFYVVFETSYTITDHCLL